LTSLLRSQMSKFLGSCMVMKADAPGAFLTDGRQITQLLLTDNEP